MQATKRGSEAGMTGSAKKQRGEMVNLRFLLQSKHAGGIIGKGGQTIKRLRSEFNATVNVPDSNTQERVLSIQATQDNAVCVLKECLTLYHEPPFSVQSGGGSGMSKAEFEINFLIHSSQVGGVIGRQGYKVKELRETTKAQVKVFPDCLPMSTERVIAIAGSEGEIVCCLNEILKIMQEVPIKGPIHMYDPAQEFGQFDNEFHGGTGIIMGMGRGGRGGGRGGRGGGPFNPMGPGNFNQGGPGVFSGRGGGQTGNFGPMGGRNPNNDFGGMGDNQGFGSFGGENYQGGGESGDIQTDQVSIPKDLAGAIIGRGGERIRSIRMKCGAEIKIDDPSDKKDRMITITGTQKQINYGQFLMQQSVRQFASSSNSNNSSNR